MMPLETYFAIKALDFIIGISLAVLLLGGFFLKLIAEDWWQSRKRK